MEWKKLFSAKKTDSRTNGAFKCSDFDLNKPNQAVPTNFLTKEEKIKAGAKHFSRDFTYAIDQLSRE